MGDLKEDLAIVKDDLATITIKEEVIEELENLERYLAFTAEMAARKQVDDKKLAPLHYQPFDGEEYKQENYTKEELKSNFAQSINNVDDSKMEHIINLEKDKLVENKPKEHHSEHSKSHSTVHSSHLKKHKSEDATSRGHSASSEHKIK